MADFELVDSIKLISRKIWVAVNLSVFYTVLPCFDEHNLPYGNFVENRVGNLFPIHSQRVKRRHELYDSGCIWIYITSWSILHFDQRLHKMCISHDSCDELTSTTRIIAFSFLSFFKIYFSKVRLLNLPWRSFQTFASSIWIF